MGGEEVEAAIQAHHHAHELDIAFALALAHYGDELFGFLYGLARDRTQAQDAFSAACERMWRGFEAFRWESSFRVWAYRIARNEFLRGTRETARAKRQMPLSAVPSIQQAIERTHSSTPIYERTEVKDKFAKLRAELTPDDHMLLGLRIDRKLPWAEIAKVLAPGDEAPTARDLAALRKRFERLKVRLRELAQTA